MYYLLPTLLTIFVSLLVIRAGAIGLKLTGMPFERAKFQAISAFTGTGFTTREAETVVNHPLRRTIVSWLMILGNVGIVTVIITATSSFVSSGGSQLPINLGVLAVGVALIYILVTRTRLLDKWETVVTKRFEGSAAFEDKEVEHLLHFAEGYGLTKMSVRDGSAMDGKTLRNSQLDETGFIVLGVERGATWISAPFKNLTLESGDRLVVYGYHPTAEFPG